MARVIELNPTAFASMGEEDLRWLFLIPLNLKYEGQASGEAFNYLGKTDILVRERDRNLFVAECKVWNGPRSLSSAIDQVLGYVTWRDTRTAVLLFSRKAGFSRVLEQIPTTVKSHAGFRRELSKVGETSFRYVVARPDDSAREVNLTVLAFDLTVSRPE